MQRQLTVLLYCFPLGIGSRVSSRSRARDEIRAEKEQIREDSNVALATLLPNRAMFESAQKDANPVPSGFRSSK